jgi:hypothetical protein
MGKQKKHRGPKPDHLQLEGNWQDAVKKAIKKEKPADGWPEKSEKKS